MNQRNNYNPNEKEVQLRWRKEKGSVDSLDNALDDYNDKSLISVIARQYLSSLINITSSAATGGANATILLGWKKALKENSNLSKYENSFSVMKSQQQCLNTLISENKQFPGKFDRR